MRRTDHLPRQISDLRVERKTGLERAVRTLRVRDGGLDLLRRAANDPGELR